MTYNFYQYLSVRIEKNKKLLIARKNASDQSNHNQSANQSQENISRSQCELELKTSSLKRGKTLVTKPPVFWRNHNANQSNPGLLTTFPIKDCFQTAFAPTNMSFFLSFLLYIDNMPNALWLWDVSKLCLTALLLQTSSVRGQLMHLS